LSKSYKERKREREERNRLHPRRRPLLADSANLKGAQSISTGAQYMTVQTKKLDDGKVKT